ncbi:MAG: hypothetical protein IIX29_05765, partial [Bacteroidales bacterium]|nr:hypothetical protein [Bacteroidales bacterium]
FYNDGNVCKLVSVEEAKVQWGSGYYDIKINDWDGLTVMDYFKSLNPDLRQYPALKWCNEYGQNFYLPKYNELVEINAHLDIINATLSQCGFDKISGVYWSSDLAGGGWGRDVLDTFDFKQRIWGCSRNTNTEYVRAVFSFSLL